MIVNDFLSRLKGVKSTTRGKWMAYCPVHETVPDGHKQSLSVTSEDGNILIHCFAGCKAEFIVAAMGLSMNDLFTDDHSSGNRKTVATYDYTDENGKLIFQVVRTDPKGFWQRRPDGNGGWVNNIKGMRRVLYRLHDLIPAIRRKATIFVVEGEKDADTLRDAGFIATCNPGGAGKWRPEYSQILLESDVIVCPDQDQTGKEHGDKILHNLSVYASRLRLLDLAGVKDVSEWFEKGGTAGQLQVMVDSLPDWMPAPTASTIIDPWPDPSPLFEERPPAPPFPAEILPEKVRRFAVGLANHMCVALEAVAVAALVAGAGVLGRRIGNCPLGQGYYQAANLWGMIVAGPGYMKTDIMAATLRPIVEIEHDEQERFDGKKHDRLTQIEVLNAIIKDKKADPTIKAEARMKLDDLEKIQSKRLTCSDTTIEKLGELLARNPDGILQTRDELSGWFSGFERPGHESDRSHFLELWNGTGDIRIDRIGRGSLVAPGCLSLLGLIQPSRLERHLSEAVDHAGDDGMMSRFSLISWPAVTPAWEPQPFDAKGEDWWNELVHALYEIKASGEVIERSGIPCISLDFEAQELWQEWRDQNMNQVRFTGKKEPARAAAMAKHNSLVVRSALLFQALSLAEEGKGEIFSVSEFSLMRAFALSAWAKEVLKRVYATESSPGRDSAKALYNLICQGHIQDETTFREVYRDRHRHLTTLESVIQAATILASLNIVRIDHRGKSRVLIINPKIKENLK